LQKNTKLLEKWQRGTKCYTVVHRHVQWMAA